MNNPDTTWHQRSFAIPYSNHEDTAGNPIHFLLAVVALLLVPCLRQCRGMRVSCYAVGVLLSGILFCLLLRWQPYASRLHTAGFLLSAPLIGLGIAATRAKAKLLSYAILTCLVLYAMPFILMNNTRALLSRDWSSKARLELYFQNRPELFDDYRLVIQFLQDAHAQDVGLYLKSNHWNYPLWVLAQAHANARAPLTFRYVGVSNVSRKLQAESVLPSYVLSTQDLGDWEDHRQYRLAFSTKAVSVFQKVIGD